MVPGLQIREKSNIRKFYCWSFLVIKKVEPFCFHGLCLTCWSPLVSSHLQKLKVYILKQEQTYTYTYTAYIQTCIRIHILIVFVKNLILFKCWFCCSFHRLFAAPHSTGIGLSRHKLLSPTCWAIGVTRIGAGNVSDDSSLKGNENGSLLGAFDESAPAPFGTLDAEITPETIDFFVSDAEGDPDCPTKGYSSIEQALNTLREGKVYLISLILCCCIWLDAFKLYRTLKEDWYCCLLGKLSKV